MNCINNLEIFIQISYLFGLFVYFLFITIYYNFIFPIKRIKKTEKGNLSEFSCQVLQILRQWIKHPLGTHSGYFFPVTAIK